MSTATITAPDNRLLEQYRANRIETDKEFFKMVLSPFYFNLYMLGKLPMGIIAGLKLASCDQNTCKITVPYRYLNQNPFKSTYFAVLAMAAEMSTGMLAVKATYKCTPSVSMLVTHLEADFVKKATGLTTFTCNQGNEMTSLVEKAIVTGEGTTFTAQSIGTSPAGEVEAKFNIQWSFKARLKK
jgi:Domain of unknown function (DUF4442)